MDKQELIEKIEKFDLTNEQLQAIENIVAGEIEVIDYKRVLNEISERILNVENQVVDISDVGNEIGIAVGGYLKSEEDKKDFVDGIYHGISLIDGSHNSGETIFEETFD